MPASIIFNQSGAPAGVAGKARNDFVIASLVTCTNSVAAASYLWTLVDVPIRSALVRGTTGASASFTFTPDVKGTYLVTLRVNASTAPTDNASSFCAAVTVGVDKLGWRYAAAGERTEDNITRVSLGFPANINPRGWATDRDLQDENIEIATYRVLNAVTTSPGPGATPLVKLNSGTGKLDTSILPASVTATTFIYDSTATPAGNLYNNFATAVTAANALNTLVNLIIAESSVNISSGGPYDLSNIILVHSTQGLYPDLTFSGTSTISVLPRGVVGIDLIIEPDSPSRIAMPAGETLTFIVGPYSKIQINRDSATAATGLIVVGPGGTAGLNTTSFVLDDGVNPAVTFIYALSPGVDTPTTRYIGFTIPDTVPTIATSTRAVINAAPTLDITATGGSSVILDNDTGGTAGNVAISHSLPFPFVVSGMAGGTAVVGAAWDLNGTVWTVHLEDGTLDTSADTITPAITNGIVSIFNHHGSVTDGLTGISELRNYSDTFNFLQIGAATYDLNPMNTALGINTATTAVSVQLCDPQLVTGHLFYLYDINGSWATNNVTLVPFAAELIDNVAASYVLNVDGSAIVIGSNGVNWYIVASHGLGGGAGGLTAHQIAGATGITTTTRNSEVVLGGFYFDPTLYTTPSIDFRLVGDFTSADGSSYLELRLYDMGAGTGAFSPVLRSDAQIAFAAVGERRVVTQALTLDPTPGTNIDEIHDVARVYELRAYFSSTDGSSSAHISWGGFAIS